MLYDKRWEKPEVKADPFSLESLIAWLEKQPADKMYCYQDLGHCLLGQYFRSCGFLNVQVGGSEVGLNGRDFRLSEAFANIAVEYPRTFGAALERARKAAR